MSVLEGHTKEVDSVAWSPNGRQVVTASTDGTARIWIADSGLLVARLTERVCKIMRDEEIRTEIAKWRGCEVELAAVAEELEMYWRLRGR